MFSVSLLAWASLVSHCFLVNRQFRWGKQSIVDKISQECRSENMRRIHSKNTLPELTVRRLIHGMGYRYRLHANDLPGKPDIVFRNRKKVIFVHGCFWHQHKAKACKNARKPKTNKKFWSTKLERNVLRDKENQKSLKEIGWKILVIWECELKNLAKLKSRIEGFLS